MMVILSVAALVCGVLAGTLDVLPGALDFLSEHTGAVLYVLMFSVGISVGLHRGLLQELRRHHVKILIIPLGITAASALGGVVCALITRMPLGLGAAITSGMGIEIHGTKLLFGGHTALQAAKQGDEHRDQR